MHVPLMSYTLHYGLGVFEGVRAYEGDKGPAVFRLREHIERLQNSAKLVRMDLPFSVEEIMKGCTDTLAANGMKAGYLRPIAFVDDGKRGLGAMNNRVRIGIVVWPWGAYLGEEGLRRGIRAQISSIARMSPRSFLPKGKISGQYVNSILAKRAAVTAGFDEAILLDEHGNVSEATGENVFWVKNGVVHTPPVSSPILEGITRDSVLQLARRAHIPVVEDSCNREGVYLADELFLTGTAAEVTPVREVDCITIGHGARGPITERLQATYFDAVHGRVPGLESWLTPYAVPL
jgi:branched-chain amino acid aminotransferase